MTTNSPPSYCEMVNNIYALYGEHTESGYPHSRLLTNLLYKEKVRVQELENKINYLEKRLNSRNFQ